MNHSASILSNRKCPRRAWGMTRRLLAVCLLTAFTAIPVRGQAKKFTPKRDTVYQNAVVACDHPLASQAGLEMLQQGGNCVDAAVASSFALSVVRPASCGIGGGGFMVIWDAKEQKSVAIDYRERAPLRANRNMFVEANKTGKLTSQYGHLANAVPGNVAGLALAAEKYGSLPLSKILAPAIRYAREGVDVDANERGVQRTVLQQLKKFPDGNTRFSALVNGYLNRGTAWQDGDRFRSPQLPALELIAKEGAAAFYSGDIADAIVAESRRGGGIIRHDDLKQYQPVLREPLKQSYANFDVLTMPPPSSGGVAILQIMNILDEWESRSAQNRIHQLQPDHPRYKHLLVEAMKHAFADRAAYLGDTDFVDVPVKRLISREYAANLLNRILPGSTRPPADYGRYAPLRDAGTSHISIIDRDGNAVACTETVNTYFGSKVVDPKFGLVMNNEMDDFSAVPGEPNAFGLLQSERNEVEPRKKPLSSMTPTIILQDNKAILVAGASGGPRIITATLQVMLNQIYFGMTPDEAVRFPRVHHQWMPDTLYFEPSNPDTLISRLRQHGHQTKSRKALGVCQTVSRSNDGLRGASDPRKYGAPAGY